MILLKILLLLSLLSLVLPLHRYPRTPSCQIDQYYDDLGICEMGSVCEKPIDSSPMPNAYLSCGPDYVLQHSSDFDGVEGKWNKVTESECSSVGDILISDGVQLKTKAVAIRCIKERGCDIDNYPKLTCGPKEECEKPQKNGDTIECKEGFQLEGVFGWSNYGWKDIDSMICTANQIKSITVQDAPSDVGIVLELRCMRLKTENFFSYNVNDCRNNAKDALSCDPPITWSPQVTCDSGHILEVKTLFRPNPNSEQIDVKWLEVEKAEFKLNKFTGIAKEGAARTPLARLPHWLRCSRAKCSSCDNPCSTCVSTDVEYNKNRNWDECARFSCGPHSRTRKNSHAFNDIGESLNCVGRNSDGKFEWIKEIGKSNLYTWTGDIQCEILCTKKSPLISQKNMCPPNDNFCDPGATDKLRISDDKPIVCSIIVHKAKDGKKESQGSQIDCDKTTGTWKIRGLQGAEIDLDEGYVWCKSKCEFAQFCPLCVTKTTDPVTIHCPPDHKTWIKYKTSDEWKELPSAAYFICKKGRWKDEKRKDLGYQASVVCKRHTTSTLSITTTPLPNTEIPIESSTTKDGNDIDQSAQQGGIGTGSYILIFFGILVAILLVTCIVFKVRGKGWLHTIMLAKLRGDKKKVTKDKKKKKKGGKGKKEAESPGESVKNGASPGVSGKEQMNGDSPIGESPAASTKAETVTGTPGESNKEGGEIVGTPDSNRKE